MLFKKGLNGRIVGVLADNFPLQVHEIRALIIERYQVKNSTQAIHLALNNLTKEEVVVKKHHQYQMSHNFIISLDKEVRKMKESYFAKKASLFQVPKNGKQVIHASSLLEQDDCWNSIIRENIGEYSPASQVYVQKVPHAWFSLSNIGEEISIATTILENSKGFYTLVNSNTVLDKWVGRFYAMNGSYYQLRKKPDVQECNYQLAVLGDYILESYYPKEVAQRMSAMFESVRQLSQLYLQELISIVSMPTELTIILSHNKNRAQKLRLAILGEFK